MKRNLPSMAALSNEEVGFDDSDDAAAASVEAKSKQLKQKMTPKKQRYEMAGCKYLSKLLPHVSVGVIFPL